MSVDLSVATPDQRGVLENLFQLYVHDFTENWRGMSRGELGDDGLFAPYAPLPLYWTEAGRIPLLIRVDGHLAGFALLNANGHLGLPVDRNMAEFFIVRKHRRGGVGSAAVHAIFDRYPGIWEAAVVRTNTGALAFWERAIASHPKMRDLDRHDVNSDAWNGPLFRFRIAG